MYGVVAVVMVHAFKAIWEIFPPSPVRVPPMLCLSAPLEITGKSQQDRLPEWSALPPPLLLSFAVLHPASDQVGIAVPVTYWLL